jgi:hypothetical protein
MELEQADIAPDESTNLLDFCREQSQKAQQQFDDNPNQARQQQLATVHTQLQWLEKFATEYAHPEQVGLSTTA